MASGRNRTILTRQLETREKLWPGVVNDQLWYRRDRNGFATVPRTMPLMMSIMDDLSGKGFPVGQTYFEMFCRLFDECFLVLKGQEEMAFHAGFTGQRAVRTWRDRVRRLRDLDFIALQSGPMGELSYALFWNPYHVIRKHYQEGRVHEPKWHALVVRGNDIGATDIEQAIKAEEDAAARAAAEAAAAAAAAAAASAKARSRRVPAGDLDDEIPF